MRERARPSCRKSVWPLTVSVKPMPQSGGVRHSLPLASPSGLPSAALVEPADGILEAGAEPVLVFELDDGLRARKAWGCERQMIISTSIAVLVDGQPVPHEFSNEGYRLVAELPEGLSPGEHAVEVQFQNMNKNSVLDPHFVVEVR